MSRNTITLTATNGAKVRTVHSKKIFVVRYGDLYVKVVNGEHVRLDPPQKFAAVAKRTDSYIAALAALKRENSADVIVVSADGETKTFLGHNQLVERAQVEKNRKAFAASVGNNGEARRLAY